MNRIITIGREFGSGGRELGRRLADELRCAYYDQEIVAEIAKRTELAEEYVQRIIEHKPVVSFPIHIGKSFQVLPDPLREQEQSVYRQQCAILTELADQSDCVIVGRCADYLLRDRSPFRFFVYAEMESKLARCRAKGAEHEKLSDRELIRSIRSVDAHRAEYYGFYTDQKWGDRRNYDLCVNTTRLDLKKAARGLAALCGE